MSKGRFIVIEGTDGSGKGTQTELLVEKLKAMNISTQFIDFPRYDQNIYGELVGRYLDAEFGGIDDVSPYLACLPFAGDRMLAKEAIKEWLREGKLVVTNRYVPSNKAHMGAKLPNKERERFYGWLDRLEYKTNGIPKEDLVIFLSVAPEIGQRNVEGKGKRLHLGDKKKDIHEDNLEHLSQTSKIYLEFAKSDPKWALIECTKNGQMRTKDEIHEEILEILKFKGILK